MCLIINTQILRSCKTQITQTIWHTPGNHGCKQHRHNLIPNNRKLQALIPIFDNQILTSARLNIQFKKKSRIVKYKTYTVLIQHKLWWKPYSICLQTIFLNNVFWIKLQTDKKTVFNTHMFTTWYNKFYEHSLHPIFWTHDA